MSALLEVDSISRRFGGLNALKDVSFSINKDEIVGLIGPNGAGKTTCFNLVNGQLVPDQGKVLLEGSRIDGLPPQVIARQGVGRRLECRSTQPAELWSHRAPVARSLSFRPHARSSVCDA